MPTTIDRNEQEGFQMYKQKHRIVSLILSIIFCFNLLPTAGAANSSSNSARTYNIDENFIFADASIDGKSYEVSLNRHNGIMTVTDSDSGEYINVYIETYTSEEYVAYYIPEDVAHEMSLNSDDSEFDVNKLIRIHEDGSYDASPYVLAPPVGLNIPIEVLQLLFYIIVSGATFVLVADAVKYMKESTYLYFEAEIDNGLLFVGDGLSSTRAQNLLRDYQNVVTTTKSLAYDACKYGSDYNGTVISGSHTCNIPNAVEYNHLHPGMQKIMGGGVVPGGACFYVYLQ